MERFTLTILALFFVLTILFLAFGSHTRDANEIVIWTQDLPPGRAVLDSLLGSFMRQNPGIKASERYYETEELRSNYIIAALGGSGPDLIYGPADQVGPFEIMGIIQPLEELFEPEFFEKFDPNGVVRYKGHIYQIADRIGNHLTLVYNRRLLRTPPRTTDELLAVGPGLTKDVDGDGLTDQYALVWNFIEPFFFVPFLGGFGGWVMDDSGRPTLNTPATVAACKFIVTLRDQGIIPRECDIDLANQLFKKQNAAMVINGPWSWGGYVDAGVDIGLARIPQVSSTGLWPTPMVSATGYSLNINCLGQRRDIALRLIRFLTEPDNELAYTRKLSAIPSRFEALSSPLVLSNPILQRSQDQLTVGRPMPINPEMRAIWDAMRPPYQNIFNGRLTPEQAAAEMQKLADQKIAEMFE